MRDIGKGLVLYNKEYSEVLWVISEW
jgi:hypothetical protein